MSMVFEHGVRRCVIAPPVSHSKSSVGNSQRQRTIQNDLSETSRCDNVALNFDWMCAVCMSRSCCCCCCRRCQCLLVHKFNSNDSRPTDGKSTLDMRTNKCSISKTASAHMARRLGKVSWFALKCVTSDATHAISAKSLEKFCLFSFSLFTFLLFKLSTGTSAEWHSIRLAQTRRNTINASQIGASTMDIPSGAAHIRRRSNHWLWIFVENTKHTFVVRTQLFRIHRSFCVCSIAVNCFVGDEMLCVAHKMSLSMVCRPTSSIFDHIR